MKQIWQYVWCDRRDASSQGYRIVLTRRQREVLLLLCEGLSNKAIARRLGVTDATVKSHVAGIRQSLNVDTRLQAVALAFALGLVRTASVTGQTTPVPATQARSDAVAA